MKTTTPSVKILAITWLILVLFHFTILGLSMLKLGTAGTVIILALAVTQMILVMLIFMEVRHSDKLIRVVAAAGFFWLLIQFTLTGSDYITRAFH